MVYQNHQTPQIFPPQDFVFVCGVTACPIVLICPYNSLFSYSKEELVSPLKEHHPGHNKVFLKTSSVYENSGF